MRKSVFFGSLTLSFSVVMLCATSVLAGDQPFLQTIDFSGNSYVFDSSARSSVALLNSDEDVSKLDENFVRWNCHDDEGASDGTEDCEKSSLEKRGLGTRLRSSMGGAVDWKKYSVVIVGAGVYANGDGYVRIDRISKKERSLIVEASEGQSAVAIDTEIAPATAVVIKKVAADEIRFSVRRTVKVYPRQ